MTKQDDSLKEGIQSLIFSKAMEKCLQTNILTKNRINEIKYFGMRKVFQINKMKNYATSKPWKQVVQGCLYDKATQYKLLLSSCFCKLALKKSIRIAVSVS